jgi:hypothetical protein
MTDYYEKINEACQDAEAREWVRVPGQYNPMWRRSVEHPTPSFAHDNGWWPGMTYSSHEFVSFILRERTRAPRAVYGTSRVPWTGRTDRPVSFKRALEILSAETADVHENHYNPDRAP